MQAIMVHKSKLQSFLMLFSKQSEQYLVQNQQNQTDLVQSIFENSDILLSFFVLLMAVVNAATYKNMFAPSSFFAFNILELKVRVIR